MIHSRTFLENVLEVFMDIALFSGEGLLFVYRWFHLFFGIIWIGMLYYFNFVQGAFFAEADANTKSVCTQKLVPRALWWFRWGAMITFITGWLIIVSRAHRDGAAIFMTSWGVLILTGGLLGSLMWFNVWFVIWPAQKVVIENAIQTAAGKPANPEAATRAARALVASRTNVMFSIAMLFCMGAANHLPMSVDTGSPHMALGIATLIMAALEINALKGKTGPMTTVKGVIHCGFTLALVLYGVIEVCL